MALYESEARFVARSGETLVGHDQIRKVLGGIIDAKTWLDSRVLRTVTVGDIAQLYTDFEGTTSITRETQSRSVKTPLRSFAANRMAHGS